MNYYLKKRVQNHITKIDMANALGLNYSFYSAIEKGSVKMPLNLIDKFNEIINRGKENEIERVQNDIDSTKFWEEVKQKNSNGNYVLFDKMKEFNINSLKELAELLGYSSTGTIYNYLQERNPVGKEFMKRLYSFFSDETNIQIPRKVVGKSETGKKRIVEKAVNPKLDRYYEKTDFRKILKDYNITNKQIAEAVGVDNSVISRLTSRNYKPSYKIIQSVKDYLDSVTKKEDSTVSSEYISKQKIISECQKEIEENNLKLEELRKQIADIEAKIELTNKVMQVISNM